jgi:WD40 repeat protein
VIRVALLVAVALAACKGEKSSKAAPKVSPEPAKPVEPHGVTIEPAASKLPGELWVIDDGSPRRVLRLANGTAREIGKGSEEALGALYPTRHRLRDGRTLAIASHGDGRPEGERLVLIGDTGSITTLGDPATQVRDPALSPDGTWIVAAVQIEGITNLTLIEVASGASKPLTTNREGNFTPIAISKDTIAFVSSRDGDSEIYRMNVDGTKVQRLTAFHREDFEPAIDASGKQLAFTSDREQMVPRIFAVVPDGTGVRRLTAQTDPKVEEGTVVWSPKSPGAYAYTIKRDGRELVVAVNEGIETVLTPLKTNDSEVAFSPDGKWLVLVRQREGASNTSASNTSAPSGGHAHDHHGSSDAELVAYPLPTGEPIVIARGPIRTPRWF